jgi:hypothetical protein
MKKNEKKLSVSYELEADVLRVEISNAPIDYAKEIGNIVVHFSKKDVPVYFEILEATKFLRKATALLPQTHRGSLEPALL